MDILSRAPGFTFRTKTLGEEFCMRLRKMAAMYDVVTVNDVLKDRGEPSVRDGYKYGYHKKDIRKLKPERYDNYWRVVLPVPGRMVRDANGYWTTE